MQHDIDHAPGAASAAGRVQPSSTPNKYVVLAVLLAVYTLNSIDRSIISILGQPIKEELRLEDWQLGLMSGLGFSFLYVAFGFPLARLADKNNRVTLLSICLVAWSGLSALCGLTVGFVQLLMARMGVGAAEAGCLPASHSLISDYFPRKRRATALAIFGLGLPLGGLFGTIAAGVLVEMWSWRTAFIVAGLAGAPLTLLLMGLVREPPRGQFETAATSPTTASVHPSFKDCVAHHVRSPISRNILIAITLLMTFTSPLSVFLAPFIIRKFDVSYSDLGMLLAGSFMIGGAIATLFGGVLADWFGARDRRWYLLLPAVGVTASVFFYIAAFLQSQLSVFTVLLFLASATGLTFLAPCYAMLHTVATPQMRATTTAIAQFLMNFVGMGVGPLLAGLTTDVLANHFFGNAVDAGQFASSCPGGVAPSGSSSILVSACRDALTSATQLTLISASALLVWPVLHLYRGAQALKLPTSPIET